MRPTVFLIVLLAGCSSNTGPSPSSTLLYVANQTSNAVTAYAPDGNGDVAPSVTIAGARPDWTSRSASCGTRRAASTSRHSIRAAYASSGGWERKRRADTGHNRHQHASRASDWPRPRRHGRLYVSNGGDTITIYAAGCYR